MNITVKGVKKVFKQGAQELVVLHGIDVTFNQGTSYAITGVSGIGKSTFLQIVAGLDAPTEGAVYFGDKNIADFTPAEKSLFLNKTIGLVFQSPYLIPELSVLENIMVPGLIAEKPLERCKERARDLLQKLKIEDKADSFPNTLSGGQQQRAALARAIFNEPKFLLADEPTGNLDMQTGKTIVDLLLQLQKETGMGIIVSSHDQYVAQNMERVFKLQDGLLVKS